MGKHVGVAGKPSSPAGDSVPWATDAVHVGPGAPYSPYSGILGSIPFVILGLFLFTKTDSTVWLAILLLFLFGGGGIFIAVMSARRIRPWHRARRAAKTYIAEHGGSMPRRLRILG
ncbi:hypothetical protein GCM10025780_07950 [Frondihabitans cladoniiphilus]|uniref:Uncharacterized protein n=1 Tax=Frondihabitans cladoniiphilus TaxID=715785 RepID=A0ABP8VQC9_9MICO